MTDPMNGSTAMFCTPNQRDDASPQLKSWLLIFTEDNEINKIFFW